MGICSVSSKEQVGVGMMGICYYNFPSIIY